MFLQNKSKIWLPTAVTPAITTTAIRHASSPYSSRSWPSLSRANRSIAAFTCFTSPPSLSTRNCPCTDAPPTTRPAATPRQSGSRTLVCLLPANRITCDAASTTILRGVSRAGCVRTPWTPTPPSSVASVLGRRSERGRDLAEDDVDVRAGEPDRADADEGDQRDEQRVLEQVLPLVVVHERPQT